MGISPRPERGVRNLLDRPRALLRKGRARQPRLRHRLQRRVPIGGGERLGQEGLEARIVVEVIREAVALDADARFPARTALVRLILPFEKVKQEDAQVADQLALFRSPHAVDFLSDMLDVGLPKLSRPQQFGLLATPGEKIAIVERALHGH